MCSWKYFKCCIKYKKESLQVIENAWSHQGSALCCLPIRPLVKEMGKNVTATVTAATFCVEMGKPVGMVTICRTWLDICSRVTWQKAHLSQRPPVTHGSGFRSHLWMFLCHPARVHYPDLEDIFMKNNNNNLGIQIQVCHPAPSTLIEKPLL